MMHEIYQKLLELQELDLAIARAESTLESFEPQLAEVEAPVVELEQQSEALKAQLQQMKLDVRRLERAAEEKRERLARYEERLDRVRNAREEAAARTELDLIRRAVDADEQEALQFMDQVMRGELKLDEMEKQLAKLRAEVEPRRQELLEAKQGAGTEVGVLRDRRSNHALHLEPAASRLYERVRAGRTTTVLAALLDDGACGHCFSVVPIQQQTEIRQARSLYRCEVCGVILYPG